ncbi:hypothetical protein DL95DRAFT_321163, partial [Leptodontidium sp. 2 PMI_412]
KTRVYIITAFLVSFVTIIILRVLLKTLPCSISLFANLYLTRTIIFGGGLVIIPLLREYIVAKG